MLKTGMLKILMGPNVKILMGRMFSIPDFGHTCISAHRISAKVSVVDISQGM